MFFIFGSPRSGTTLLAQCLNAHPEIVIPHETDFIIPMAFVCDRITDVDERRAILKRLIPRTAGFGGSLGEFVSSAEVEAIVDLYAAQPACLLEAIYAAIAAKNNRKIAGDKSPNDLLFLRMLVKVGGISPKTRIIHIVRDPRDVLASIMSAQLTDVPEVWFPGLWNSSNIYLNNLYGASEQYCLVKYENFACSPEQELKRICAHLGVNFSASMLDEERRSARYRGSAHHSKLYEPISPRNIANYKTTLSDGLIARCEEQAGLALHRFGYSVPG
jgi:hypothetical protein